MNRRSFLKTAATATGLYTLARCTGNSGPSSGGADDPCNAYKITESMFIGRLGNLGQDIQSKLGLGPVDYDQLRSKMWGDLGGVAVTRTIWQSRGDKYIRSHGDPLFAVAGFRQSGGREYYLGAEIMIPTREIPLSEDDGINRVILYEAAANLTCATDTQTIETVADLAESELSVRPEDSYIPSTETFINLHSPVDLIKDTGLIAKLTGYGFRDSYLGNGFDYVMSFGFLKNSNKVNAMPTGPLQ